MSHLLSALFAVCFCALAALVSLPRLIKEPRRILAILAAAIVTALCSAWFILPMLEYMREGISTSVVLDASRHVLKLGSYLVLLSGNNGSIAPEREDFAYTIGVVPGVALLLGCALLLVRLYAMGRADERRREYRLEGRLMLLGALALLGATEFFPWKWAVSLPHPYSTLFMQLQFPWRLVSVAVPMLVLVSARGYLFDRRRENLGLALLLTLAMVTSGYTMQCFVQDPVVLEKDSFVDTRIGQYEYTYVGTEKEALVPGQIIARGEKGAAEVIVSAFEKRGTNLDVTLTLPNGARYIELPLLYYPGYAVTDGNGQALSITRGENNRIRLYAVRGGEETTLHVRFAEPMRWRAAEAISLAGLAALLALMLRMRRRGA